ncbi:hypothetical protein HZY97_03465 [Sphingomonas sp. R-74633]|uniref:hypothetical protein n=1 Tax=Sphingomonas sp. R-74633 TaxID=2751188 RepID=UPI0015D224C7|nr:hypothetical protein [Sphingomonas sp. R-74633]NYT39803.1 hypothetical protein [Sphingomonas sp. R-74633]
MMFFALSLLALAPPQDAAIADPVSAADAVALFKRVCADPFPDPARFKAAVEAPDLGLRIVTKPPEAMGQPGDRWNGRNAQFSYTSADWLPRDLPSPQCSMRVRLASVPDHAGIAAATAEGLGLPAGKTSGKRRQTTQWDVGNARYFLNTATLPDGTYEMSLMLLNLRDKK